MNDSKTDNPLIQLSGLWKQTSKNNTEYMKGSNGSIQYLVFPNTKKTADNQPDFYICLGKYMKKTGSTVDHDKEESDNGFDEDDIPF